jgi:hypothetical protein
MAVPPGSDKPRFDEVIAFIHRETGAENWERDDVSIRAYDTTLSLVIRQTASMHEKIADKLGQLRRDGSTQVSCSFVVITGPRGEIAPLAERFPGEFGEHEKDELIETVKNSKSLQLVGRPQICTATRATVGIYVPGIRENEDETSVLKTHYVVADDPRSIRVKIAITRENDSADVIGNVQFAALHSGRTAAIHFEADRHIPSLPPPDNAHEVLVLVTPRVIVQEEEEELLGIPTDGVDVPVGTVTPRIIIQEEEEELLETPVEQD